VEFWSAEPCCSYGGRVINLNMYNQYMATVLGRILIRGPDAKNYACTYSKPYRVCVCVCVCALLCELSISETTHSPVLTPRLGAPRDNSFGLSRLGNYIFV